MESLTLFRNNKEKSYFLFIVLIIFSFNLNLQYNNYTNFKNEEVFQTDATIINIYQKQKYQVLKLQTKEFVCFTSTTKQITYKKMQDVNLYLLTNNIDFIDYLKGFYTKNFNLQIQNKTILSTKEKIMAYIDLQHNNTQISSLYKALFLAIPVESSLRDIFASYGISHLIAISGFHLGVISFILYFLFHMIYKPIHQRYLPFRNKRFDLMIFISIILLIYLIFVNLVPSLLRSFTMFIFGLFLLRNNIKIFSFETLLIIILIIIALFPKLIFSLSLWFSIAGVFYIYLFIQYFKKMNKYIAFLLFNFWIYFSLNPITHYFFETTALEQLYSPIITIGFTIFYPFSAFLHIINLGEILDSGLNSILNYDIITYKKLTPLWFFILYLMFSFLSIFSKKSFIVLNILFLLFNFWLFLI